MGVTRNKKETCDRILTAALEEFAEHGYSLTKLSDIGVRAGVAPSLVSKHFGNKEELFRAVMLKENSIYLAWDSGFSSLFDAFSAIAHHISIEAQNSDVHFRFAFMYLMSFDIPENCRNAVKEAFSRSSLCNMISAEQREGMLKDIEPYAWFHMFLKSSVGIITAYLEAGLPIPDDSIFLHILGYKDEQKLNEYIRKNVKEGSIK